MSLRAASRFPLHVAPCLGTMGADGGNPFADWDFEFLGGLGVVVESIQRQTGETFSKRLLDLPQVCLFFGGDKCECVAGCPTGREKSRLLRRIKPHLAMTASSLVGTHRGLSWRAHPQSCHCERPPTRGVPVMGIRPTFCHSPVRGGRSLPTAQAVGIIAQTYPGCASWEMHDCCGLLMVGSLIQLAAGDRVMLGDRQRCPADEDRCRCCPREPEEDLAVAQV